MSRSELDINITINAGAEILTNTLEIAWVSIEQIGELVRYFREKIEGIKIHPDTADYNRYTIGAALSALDMISRDAERVAGAVRAIHEIAESAAAEVAQ